MNFQPLPLKGAFIIDLEIKEDDRGFFARHFCEKEFSLSGLPSRYVQNNLSYNPRKGTLRGLHKQIPPFEEGKLVSCMRGQIFDVMVDLRPDSSTYLQWWGEVLSQSNFRQVYIPPGFAHGFQTLVDESLVCYQMTEFYQAGSETGVRWDDPKIKINWPFCDHRIISDRDLSLPYMGGR